MLSLESSDRVELWLDMDVVVLDMCLPVSVGRVCKVPKEFDIVGLRWHNEDNFAQERPSPNGLVFIFLAFLEAHWEPFEIAGCLD